MKLKWSFFIYIQDSVYLQSEQQLWLFFNNKVGQKLEKSTHIVTKQYGISRDAELIEGFRKKYKNRCGCNFILYDLTSIKDTGQMALKHIK